MKRCAVKEGEVSKDYPILFSTPMVQALLEGRKTQTRRLAIQKAWRTVKPGDRLWVRETFSTMQENGALKAFYKADEGSEMNAEIGCSKFKPSIHMPRWASRLTLVVTDVRTERLQDISEEDAIAEGVEKSPFTGWKIYYKDALINEAFASPIHSFESLWKSINGNGAWDANPIVIVITFEVHQRNIDEVGNETQRA